MGGQFKWCYARKITCGTMTRLERCEGILVNFPQVAIHYFISCRVEIYLNEKFVVNRNRNKFIVLVSFLFAATLQKGFRKCR